MDGVVAILEVDLDYLEPVFLSHNVAQRERTIEARDTLSGQRGNGSRHTPEDDLVRADQCDFIDLARDDRPFEPCNLAEF